jgi:carboxypeptidase Taq
LEEIVQLNREKADALKTGSDAHPYDALLDAFEPDMTVAQLDPLFEQLEAALTPLLQQIQQGKKIADSLPVGPYPKDRQLAYSQTVLTAMGFDSNHGRLDESVHPFTCGVSPTDVRLTTRIDEADPFSLPVFCAA